MKRTLSIILLALFLLPAAAKKKATTSPVQLTNLKTENMVEPLGISTTTPRFSWQLTSTQQDVMQTAYHILVASSPELLQPGKADLWDSGLVQSDASLWIDYAGAPLKDNQQAYWAVSTTTTKGTTSWALPQRFSIGLTVESHWKGRWIGIDRCLDGEEQGYRSRLNARYIRKEIDLKGEEIKRATAYIAAVGLYQFYINGKRIGNDALAPNPTDTRKSIIYNTFDITDALRTKALEPERKANKHGAISTMMALAPEPSKSCIGIVLGNGRAFPMRQSKPHKWPFMGFPKCRINIIIEYANGSTQTISSDEKWKLTNEGPIRSNNEYDGEVYDATMCLGDWTTVGYDDSKWMNAERTDIPQAELIGQNSANMQVGKIIKPLSIKPLGGKYIVDFGQNMAGWIQLRVRGSKGDTIRIKFAEKLNADGTLYLDNFRDALSEDTYICNGTEEANATAYHPNFVTHGFRYAMITGMNNLKADDLEAQTVSDAMETTGSITTSNDVLNRVYKNAWWGVYSNYKGMPVDCPQRNERQPWLGDRTVGSLGESYMFGNERLYSKWMRDICESQRTDGVFSDVAPAFWNYYNDDVTWPSALPFGCEMLYQQFGNKQPIIDSYPYIKKWMNHVLTEYMKDGIITKDQYGDWCVPPEDLKLIHSQDPARQTDGSLISTAYMIRNLRLMQQFADICAAQSTTATVQSGSAATYATDKAYYAALEKDMTAAFNKKFLITKHGTSPRPGHTLYPDSVFYGNNTVTANLLPLSLGIVPQDCKDEVVKNIIATIISANGSGVITRNAGHVPCGVIGISWLMRGLSDNGFADVAYVLASNTTYPSWGYMAEQGATTIWELWNGDTANPRMNSGNHVMLLGDLLTWYYQYLGGIRNAKGSVAYKHIDLRPSFEIQELDNVNMSYDTPYGKVISHWTKNLEDLHWNVTIPANTTANIHLPDGTIKTVGSGNYTFDCKMNLMVNNTRDIFNPEGGVNAKVIDSEFIYEQTDYPEVHSVSIVELKNGDLVATYFGGTKERNPDVCIWTQRKPKGSDTWTKPVLAADGVFKLGTKEAELAGLSGINDDTTPASKGYIRNKEALKALPNFHYSAKHAPVGGKAADDEQESTPSPLPTSPGGGEYLNTLADNYSKGQNISNISSPRGGREGASGASFKRKACWNPVLFQMPSGELWLFFKIGTVVADWTGWVAKSKDGGKTWSDKQPLEKGFIGPVKNKPVIIGDRLICPSSTENTGGWKFHFEIMDLNTGKWKYVGPIDREMAIQTSDMNPDGTLNTTDTLKKHTMTPIYCIQPSILIHKDGRLQAVGRTRNGKLASTFSSDNGDTWSTVTLLDVPQNQSGTDAVTLQDGRHVLIYNNFSTVPGTPKGPRTPCSLAISDDGINWRHFLTLEDSPISQYSYPAIIQGKDGSLHCAYTWRRERIAYKHITAP